VITTMEYYAHISSDGRKQTVKEHLDGVAELAEKNAIPLMKSLAHAAGKAHDLGKFSIAFQKRLHNSSIRYEHSIGGAIEYSQSTYAKSKITALPAYMLQYCIAGHHTGLPDGGTKNDTDTTLQGRLKHQCHQAETDYHAYRNEIELEFPDCSQLTHEISDMKTYIDIEKFAFFTRYLFSCLVDADYLDTEKFCFPETKRSLKADFQAIKTAVDQKLNSFLPMTELQKARGRLQQQAYTNAKNATNISILNIPTGSGKTLCSLKIALDRLLASNGRKKRIIYVIPYTSIIEQTADIFEKIFDKYADILQHHSNYDFSDDSKDMPEPDTINKLKKAAENWDAPFIITTSVQFFESLYHFKSSNLRKLHNMADAIIIFDEIHLLPVHLLQPCLKGIGYITNYLNSDAIFLSATMPDYSKLFRQYLPDCSYSVLVPDKTDFQYFKKCQYLNLGKTDFDSILEKAQHYQSSLIVVNKRKSAYEIYQNITGRKYHLSTYMTPQDRSSTIKAIRADLANGVKITVVSTSLIEAGVDFDFKAVFREIAGLDNIIQAGGRCNREGVDKSGDVYIFETDENIIRDLQISVNIVKSLLEEYEDITSSACIETYYQRLHREKKNLIEKNSITKEEEKEKKIGLNAVPFRTYANQFEFIKDDSVGVVIPQCEEAVKLYHQLKSGDYSVKRKLQKYTVSLKRHELENAIKSGILNDSGTGTLQLTNPNYYHPETGLNLDTVNDKIS
ncbi:MAG: CRISPR-associated helicase Cas3', partial [Oscillospiraceae bacterium]|nr:CRISPR-associated helicase Cas3' [Oscillospiraceae bacterium]